MKRIGMGGSTMGTLILAMLLLRWGVPSPAPQPETANAQERLTVSSQGRPNVRENKTKWPEDGPWKASRQHFAGRQPDDKCPSLKAAPKTLNDPHRHVWCIPAGVQVRAMIAIAPDPVHSHLSLVFDRTIEALQLSAESMGYVADRYWLPWQPVLARSHSEQVQALDTSEKEKQPGLLLFRWNGRADPSKPEVLYVFLVSDTSTAGINGTQFHNAVEYVREVRGAADKGRIWIMGPTFSGSLASLRVLTKPWKNLSFTAYSGTVSSMCAIANQGLLDATFTAENSQPCVEQHPHRPQNLTFESLVSNSETVVEKFLNVLKNNHSIRCGSPALSEVAIFSEAATTYGGVGKEDKEGKKDNKEGKKVSCYTSFRYPREISRLRNASASSEPTAEVSPQTGVVSVPTHLPFNLADRQPNSSDEPPDFSRAQGPLSKEAVLMKYAAELRRGHYKYAGIIGTNVVDVLFLAKFLRKACPDVRLFVLNSDLLFERDGDNVPYLGMLSLSTYPLLSGNFEGTPEQQRLPFAGEYQEGQYKAALLVMKQVVSPADPLAISSSNLPVWMTAVGTGGYWPIRLISPQPTGSADLGSDPRMYGHDFSPAWKTIAILLVGLALLLCWILWTVKPMTSAFRELALSNAAPAQRFFYINVMSASLAVALAFIITPAWRFGDQAGTSIHSIVDFAVLAIAALFVSCLYLGATLEKIRREHNRQEKDQRENSVGCGGSMILSVIVWGVAALGAWFWWGLHADGASRYGFFFGYRSTHLAAGVSPLMPMLLLLAAIFLWSVFEILRLHFDDQIRPKLTTCRKCELSPADARDSFPGFDMENRIACSVNKYFLDGNHVVAFILIFGAWLFALNPRQPFELFEKPAFGVIYGVLFCVAVALMLTSGLRLAQTWSELRKMLRELERSPIRRTFARLKLRSWSPIWQSGGREMEWNTIARSFEVMKQIKNCDRQLDPELAHSIKSALDMRDPILCKMRLDVSTANADGAGAISPRVRRFYNFYNKIRHQFTSGSVIKFRQVETMFGSLQTALATVLYDILDILRRHREAGGSEPDEDEFGKEDKPVVAGRSSEKPDLAGRIGRLEEYVALRYVAFIRAVLGHIRLWLILQAAVFSLVLLSLNVYSFEPHRALIWSFTVIFVFLGAIAFQVLIQAHRDPLISRITGSNSDQLGLHFYLRVAMLGAVPLLTLLATQFPSISLYLLSFLQPGLETLK